MQSRKAWLEAATNKTITVDGEDFEMEPRVFSTGTCGWYYNGKGSDEQRQFSIYIIGSKHWSD